MKQTKYSNWMLTKLIKEIVPFSKGVKNNTQHILRDF